MYLHSKTEYTGTALICWGGGGKGCLNFPFIVSKIVAYKCLINQIYNFMPEMLFVLQEYVTCRTCK